MGSISGIFQGHIIELKNRGIQKLKQFSIYYSHDFKLQIVLTNLDTQILQYIQIYTILNGGSKSLLGWMPILCPVKIIASLSSPKLGRAKLLIRNLGIHLVQFQLVLSSPVRFKKFLVIYHSIDQSGQFIGINQLVARFYWHAQILAWQKLVAKLSRL